MYSESQVATWVVENVALDVSVALDGADLTFPDVALAVGVAVAVADLLLGHLYQHGYDPNEQRFPINEPVLLDQREDLRRVQYGSAFVRRPSGNIVVMTSLRSRALAVAFGDVERNRQACPTKLVGKCGVSAGISAYERAC